jgi:hypothetical protein
MLDFLLEYEKKKSEKKDKKGSGEKKERKGGSMKTGLIFLALIGVLFAYSIMTSNTSAMPETASVYAATATPKAAQGGLALLSQPAAVTPTVNAELMARATQIELEKAAAESAVAQSLATQEALKAQILADEAEAKKALEQANLIKAQNEADAIKLKAQVEADRVKKEIQAILDKSALEREGIAKRNQVILWVIGGLGGLLALLLMVIIVRKTVETRLEWAYLQNHMAFIQHDQPAPAQVYSPEFADEADEDGLYGRKPAWLQGEVEYKIARRILDLGYIGDDLRYGQGIGISYRGDMFPAMIAWYKRLGYRGQRDPRLTERGRAELRAVVSQWESTLPHPQPEMAAA